MHCIESCLRIEQEEVALNHDLTQVLSVMNHLAEARDVYRAACKIGNASVIDRRFGSLFSLHLRQGRQISALLAARGVLHHGAHRMLSAPDRAAKVAFALRRAGQGATVRRIQESEERLCAAYKEAIGGCEGDTEMYGTLRLHLCEMVPHMADLSFAVANICASEVPREEWLHMTAFTSAGEKRSGAAPPGPWGVRRMSFRAQPEHIAPQ